MSHPRFHGWIVAAVAATVLLTRLGAAPLWDDDESKNAACTLAMLDAGDWLVPTFNGRLRIEKPPLVNWLQMAGVQLCGRTEAGVRISSAVLTIGTCLLTWRIGVILAGPSVGLMGGLVMATCVWTAVGGRAATPDAPLVFLTTLAFFLFARAVGRHDAPPRLGTSTAAAIGAACGAAVLAKGPVGLVLPAAAMLVFTVGQVAGGGPAAWMAAVRGLKPLTLLAAALAVALPWYAAVTIRTDGDWLRGFILVHNVGRFAAPMEGHSGSLLYYPVVIACGLYPWSMVLAVMAAHVGCSAVMRRDPQRRACQMVACWAATWIGAFSMAGTKLPGYVWPAYPALAIGTGLFLEACARRDVAFLRRLRDPAAGLRLTLAAGWAMLAVGGVILLVGLPLAARRFVPGGEWLGGLGVVPLAAAFVGWRLSAAGRMQEAVAVVAVGAALLTTLLATAGAEAFGRTAAPRTLFADGGTITMPPAGALAGFPSPPPSLVFYGGGLVPRLDDTASVAAHLTARPDACVVVDSRFLDSMADLIPPGHGVLSRVHTVACRSLLLVGPLRSASASSLATHAPSPPSRSR